MYIKIYISYELRILISRNIKMTKLMFNNIIISVTIVGC